LEKQSIETKQERYFWIFVTGTLIGVLAGGHGYVAGVFYGIFFLVFLIAMAKKLEVEYVIKPLTDVLNKYIKPPRGGLEE
jgi:hypothetical protein